MPITISPSLFAADICNLGREISILEKCSITNLHIDVMDGNFVPNIAFGPDQVKMLRSITKMEFDIHMMVINPERYIEDFVKAGADSITIHVEACKHLHRTIQQVKGLGKKVGVALNPATPLEELSYCLNLLDRLLIMTVNPGYGGQKFISEMRSKIIDAAELKRKYCYNFELQIDGGVNKSNLKDVILAGATDIVIGSATFENHNIEHNIEEFKRIISEAIR